MANALTKHVKQDALDLIRGGDKPSDPVSLVDPDTGEVVALADAPLTLLAAVLGRVEAQLLETTDQLKAAKRWLGREAIERMDDEGEWTLRSRGVKVSAPSPAARRYSWDGNDLRAILDELVDAKVISRGAALRACESRTENVPVIAGINKLLKLPDVAQRILVARRENAAPPSRSVRVELDPGEM